MKTKKGAAGAETAKITNLEEKQTGKKFPLLKQEKKDVTDVEPIIETFQAVNNQPAETNTPSRNTPSIEDYKGRIEKLHELTIKHNKLAERLREVELFEIKKDEASATIRLWDGCGVQFISHDPASLFKVLAVIKDSYVSQINEVETQVFDLMTA